MKDGGDAGCGMSVIVKTVAKWLQGLMLLFAAYVVLSGHLTPGGGFAGGVIIACVFILMTLSHGEKGEAAWAGRRRTAVQSSVGALVFLGAAVAGLILRNVFLKNLSAHSGHGSELMGAPFILICELGIAMVVGASLFLVFSVLAGMRVKPGGDGGGGPEAGSA
jgi:multicomponent Na+:H+ antiporter subunit B